MRVAILTVGTRGDLQPYIALSLGLKRAGHDVLLCGPENFTDWVAGYGIDYLPGGIDVQALLQTPEGREMVAGNPLAILRNARKIGTRLLRDNIKASTEAVEGVDVIIFHPKVPVAFDLAEYHKVPLIATAFQPILTATGEFPVLDFAGRSLGRRLNRLTYSALRASRGLFAKEMNQWRQDSLGLKPLARFARTDILHGKPVSALHAFSETVVPRPADWPAHAYMTGYWFLDGPADWLPSPALQIFLDAGAPPVYVGFGSMPDKDPAAKADIVMKALALADCRAVVSAGWGGMDVSSLPDTMFAIDGAPHDKLFPLMQAIVHHGGAGTTAAALRAGKPQIIVPYFGDQPFWGRRVEALGVAPPYLPQRKLTPQKLARALRAATKDKSMTSHAETVGRKIVQETGVTNAVQLIERLSP